MSYSANDWKIDTFRLTHDAEQYGQRVPYRWHVRGTLPDGSPFSWTIPNLSSRRYDLRSARYDGDAGAQLPSNAHRLLRLAEITDGIRSVKFLRAVFQINTHDAMKLHAEVRDLRGQRRAASR